MIDPNPLPSLQLRMLASIARWALRLLLAFWLLLISVGVALHGFIVPRISTWGGQLERLASEAIGIPIQIGEITARSEGLFPTVELSQLRLLNQHGDTALLLPRAVVTLSAKSILRLGIEQLYIESASLHVHRLANGHWQIAGIPSIPSDSEDHGALDWILTQPELVLQHGSIDFVDDLNGSTTTSLTDVNAVLRHHGWRHQIRIDATPTSAPAQALQIMGNFSQPLLPSKQAVWKRWNGQWYANASIHQLPALLLPESWRIDNIQGTANARFWLDINKGAATGLTADIALGTTSVSWLDQQLPPFELQRLQGRLSFHTKSLGWHVAASNFSFTQHNGKQWPSSDWTIQTSHGHNTLQQVEGYLSYADLSMAASVLQTLPISKALNQPLARWQPQGEIRAFKFSWSHENAYQASGQVQGLSLREQLAEHGVGTPGVQGLDGSFHIHEKGGQARLSMRDGALIFPGVFEEMNVPLDSLKADVRWQLKDDQWQVVIPKASFSNADAAGQLHATWQTGQNGRPKFPGHLELSGKLDHASGARVFRYLPLVISETARHYVRDAVFQGQGKDVKFEVQGHLQEMPFTKPRSGRFYIEAPVHDVIFNFIPPHLRNAPNTAWPALEKLSGILVFDGNSMQVRQAATSFAGHPNLQIASVSANISNLSHPNVIVKAMGHSDLSTLLNFLTHTPLSEITSHALDNAKGDKETTLSLDLNIPISELKGSRINGVIGFHGNNLHLDSHIPPLTKLHGSVIFNNQGFNLDQITAQALGGPISIRGGIESPISGLNIHANGIANTSDLQNAFYLPAVPEISRYVLGKTSYELEVKATKNEHFFRFYSDLKGLEINLPAPFNKPAENLLNLQFIHKKYENHFQETKLEIEGIGELYYFQNIEISGALFYDNDQGIVNKPIKNYRLEKKHISINFDKMDLDGWFELFSKHNLKKAEENFNHYLPEEIFVKIKSLKIKNQNISNLYSIIQKKSNFWLAQAEADQFAGIFKYYPANEENFSGLIDAKISHLVIEKNNFKVLGYSEEKIHDSSNFPELDISINEINFSGKYFGKFELIAKNQILALKRVWVIEKFNLTTDESSWQAEGNWQDSEYTEKKETTLRFSLSTKNAGQLLGRFGMTDVISDSQGKIRGFMNWEGSPLSPDIASLIGSIHLEIDKGQFLKVEPGMGKMLSVLSLQSIAKRINLDFRDIFSKGFSFDSINGDLQVNKGIATTNNLQIKGLNASVFIEGSVHLKSERQDINLLIVPEINAMTASLAATAINPAIGLGSFLAQMLLRTPIIEAATRSFHIYGSWYDPIVDPMQNESNAKERIPSLIKP